MNTNTTASNASSIQLIGRILMGVLFLVAGLMKAFNIAGTTAYMTRLGFPIPEAMAYLSTLIELAGGALLIIGWQTRKVAWFLVLYLLVATGAAHRFWEYDQAQRGNQINHFLKNLALMGGMLFIAAFGAGRNSVDKD
jgi:putative oxidoreductase